MSVGLLIVANKNAKQDDHSCLPHEANRREAESHISVLWMVAQIPEALNAAHGLGLEVWFLLKICDTRTSRHLHGRPLLFKPLGVAQQVMNQAKCFREANDRPPAPPSTITRSPLASPEATHHCFSTTRCHWGLHVGKLSLYLSTCYSIIKTSKAAFIRYSDATLFKVHKKRDGGVFFFFFLQTTNLKKKGF